LGAGLSPELGLGSTLRDGAGGADSPAKWFPAASEAEAVPLHIYGRPGDFMAAPTFDMETEEDEELAMREG
jgi:hypothetical protein